jgi:hypothetical protein
MTEFNPPTDFIPGESTIEGIEVFKPKQKEDEAQPVIDSDCPQSGATTAYGVVEAGLTCTHCGYFEPPEKPIVGKGAEEFEFNVETLQRADHGWGEERKDLECQNCGANISSFTARKRITNFCRTPQPGGLMRGM